jgi:hypothetical protein
MCYGLVFVATMVSVAEAVESGAGSSLAEFQREYESMVDRGTYRIIVTGEALGRTPSWKADQENPPVPARKAMRIANAEKTRVLTESKKEPYTLNDLTLVAAAEGKWYWTVVYRKQRLGGSGIDPSLTIVVLMDGKTVAPQ